MLSMVGASLGFHDVAVIEALEPPLWLELFDAFGAPPGFQKASATLEHIVDRLSASGLPEPLQFALEWMYNLGSEDGVERLAGVAREYNVDLSAFRGAAPVELVARVALLAVKDAAARNALERAQTGALVAALPSNRVHEFRGRTTKSLDRIEERVAVLRQRLAIWLDGLGLGERVDVTLRNDEGVHRIVVVRGKRMQAPVTFTDSGRRPLPHRPIQCDLIVYDEVADLTAIHAPQTLVEGYQHLLGELFWDDRNHLVASPCSLEPLKDGAQILERHSNAAIRRVSLTHAKFRPHEGGTCDYTNQDAFDLMRRMHVPFHEGDFVSARFQFAFHAGGGRALTVEVRPESVKVPPGPRQASVLAVLEQMGIYRVRDGGAAPLFWDLAVGAHPRAEWSRHLGPAVLETFIGQNVLRFMKRASVPHAATPGAGTILDVTTDKSDLPFFGESVHPDVAGRRLTASDVEGLQLDAPRLASLWASALGSSARPKELAIDGLFHVGECELGATRIQILLALRAPAPDFARLAPTLPTGSVIVAPQGRGPTMWLVPSVELESVNPNRLALRRALVRELRLESEVDARDCARACDTLIVDVARRSVWLHGIEMQLADGGFTFVRLVASATQRGEAATQHELTVALAGSNAAENTARMAKGKAEKTMKQQLAAAGIEAPAALFQAIKGGYRYVGSAFVRE